MATPEVDLELTAEEKRAISALKRVAKKWPDSLWLFSASGSLLVMKKNANGERALLGSLNYEFKGNTVDQDYVVDDINIENDGGDW